MPTDKINIISATPIVHTEDFAATVAYYRDILGFRVCWSVEESKYGCVARDGVELNIHGKTSDSDRARRVQVTSEYYDIYFRVNDVDTLHQEFASNGANIIFGPEDCWYGMRELGVRDPNGYKLAFGQEIESLS